MKSWVSIVALSFDISTMLLLLRLCSIWAACRANKTGIECIFKMGFNEWLFESGGIGGKASGGTMEFGCDVQGYSRLLCHTPHPAPEFAVAWRCQVYGEGNNSVSWEHFRGENTHYRAYNGLLVSAHGMDVVIASGKAPSPCSKFGHALMCQNMHLLSDYGTHEVRDLLSRE